MSPVRLPNGRDIGGHVGERGRPVRSGQVFRSGMLVSADTGVVVAELGIGKVFDLRTEPERTARPDLLPPSSELVVADVLADDPAAGAASLRKIAQMVVHDQAEMMSPDELRDSFLAGYRSFVTLPSARAAAGKLLRAAADPAAPPMVIHCTAGKDRTGWLIALILLSLGVSEDQVMTDFLASAGPVWDMFEPYREELVRRGGDLETIRVAVGVVPEYLEASFDELRSSYGSLDAFLGSGLGLPDDFRQQLADRLLEP